MLLLFIAFPPSINITTSFTFSKLSCFQCHNSFDTQNSFGSMDLQSESASPVFAEAASLTASRLGTCSGLLPYSPRYPPALLMIPRNRSGIVDDLRSISWLDAMKSSSPSQKQTMKDPNSEFASAEDDNVAHNAWTFRYPSALASFEKITKCAKGKRMALFLDYDGTLSPIVDNPDNAVMSSAMRSAVRNVAKFIPTAIISGRSCRKVYEFVGLSELYYAGSHGMDIMGPGRQSDPRKYTDIVKSVDEQYKDKRFQPACEFLPMINEIFRSLIESMSEIKGAKVENNKFCVSVHYRNVDEKSWGTIAQRVHDILKHYPRVQLTHGRKVLEVRPVIDWNKGRALEFLLESLGLSNCNDVLPIYIGDDQTDEDAFKVLRDRNIGYGILVSSAPRESNAYYSLKDPLEVLEFLKSLVTWKKAPNTL